MLKKTQSYDEWQMDRLTRPTAAAAFLNAALEDSVEMFLVALKKVAQAHQIAKVAKEAGVKRETMYRSFSGTGNPTIETLTSVLSALELDFEVRPRVKGFNAEEALKQRSSTKTQSVSGLGSSSGKQEFASGNDEETRNLICANSSSFGQQNAIALGVL
jgi:probable addiction module antidote protein